MMDFGVDEDLAAETDSDRAFGYRFTDDRFFLRSLEEDVARCEQLFAATPSDHFARRTLVRTIFAQVEGMSASAIDWGRYYAAEQSQLKDRYTEAERIVLRGEIATVNDQGKAGIEPERRYLPTKVNLRFALSLVGRGAADPPKVEYGDGGWAALLVGLSVRDRLMHPKRADDLLVADAELELVRRGRTWFVRTYESLDKALQSTVAKSLFKRIAKSESCDSREPGVTNSWPTGPS